VHDVVTVPPDTNVAEAIKLLNRLSAVSMSMTKQTAKSDLDLQARLREQSWTDFGSRNITVNDRVVHLWGLVGSAAERKALLALAESIPGVSRVSDAMIAAY
jgi:osmotically-inducible protein OsmY